MNRNGIFLTCLIGLLMVSCNQNEDGIIDSPSKQTTTPIGWSVLPIQSMQGSRALISSDDDLQSACTNGTGESIGLWGDYDLTINGVKQTIEGFLNDVKLVYYGVGGTEDSPTGWDYIAEDKYWELGGQYRFRAYYPQTAIHQNVISSSNATTFVINYNTTQMQEDLLVAYQPINTMQWSLSDPVPLKFRHALAGVRFQFQFEEGLNETDKLTSCWLQNTENCDFTSVGMLAYGTEDPNNGNQYNPNWLDWHESYNSPATERMYYWKSQEGVVYQRENGQNTLATAYTGASAEGGTFLNNNGYLLIIPQQSDGTVQLCFTTYEGGDAIYRIPLPVKTGTSMATQRANNTYDANNTLILGSALNDEGTDFVAGYLYNYTISVTKTNLDMSLSIAPWNELKSSFDISF